MNSEQTNLSKTLVKLGQSDEKYFRWMPGMADWYGMIFIGYSTGFTDYYLERQGGPDVYDYPDLTDPATAGCLWEILGNLVQSINREGGDISIDISGYPPSVALELHSEVFEPEYAWEPMGFYNMEFGEAIARAIIEIAKAEGVKVDE